MNRKYFKELKNNLQEQIKNNKSIIKNLKDETKTLKTETKTIKYINKYQLKKIKEHFGKKKQDLETEIKSHPITRQKENIKRENLSERRKTFMKTLNLKQ